jgi:hypothetical protein
MSALESIALRINTFIFQPPLRADLQSDEGWEGSEREIE